MAQLPDSIIDEAVNGAGAPPPAAPAAPAAPVAPASSSLFGAPGTQIVTGSDGKKYLVDMRTGTATPIQGVPGQGAAASDKKLEKGADGRFYLIDPGTGQATPIAGMPTDVPAGQATVPGSGSPGTTGSYTPGGSTDPSDPSAHVGYTPGMPETPDVTTAVYNAQTTRANDAAARAIAQQNAQQAQLNELNKQKELEYQHQLDVIQQKHADGVLSLEQAKQAALEAHQTISEDLQRSAQALTARGQDMSQATAERGQNLSYLGNQSYVSAGQYQALQGQEANLAKTGGVPFTPSPTPPGIGFDPAAMARQLAQQTLGSGQAPAGFNLGQK